MKKIIKSFIPYKLIILRSLIEGYSYDLKRFLKHSNSYKKQKNENQYHAIITYTYHVIEKGLTMPETRLGFGQGKIEALINLCNSYIKDGYDKNSVPITHSIKVLNEYVKFHQNHNHQLPSEITEQINRLANTFDEHCSSKQIELSKTDFLKYQNASFDEFCNSRHTVRNYSDEDIPEEIFRQCTKIAQKTPSACNRQPNHVYIVKNPSLKEKILALQSGNRGFGHLANALVVFTGDISVFRFQDERNEVYFNSGMFAMSYIYALHSKGIGSCCLNWSVTPLKDRKLRKLIHIPENETITLILSCGYLPDHLKIATSPRKLTSDIFHVIN